MVRQKSALLGLVLSLAVVGMTACEDKTEVQVPPNIPPLTISVTPQSVTIEVDEEAQLVAQVTGGETGGDKSVSWTSSNPAVASVSANGNVVTVTGESVGQATIRATATADANVSAAAVVEVEAAGGVPPSISIQSITTGATNVPVNRNNVFGQIEITLNLDVPPGTQVDRVEILADNEVIYTQSFSGVELGLAVDEAQSAVELVASWNTADFDASVLGTQGTVQGTYDNGSTTITAQVVGPQGTITANTSTDIVLNNSPFIYADLVTPTTNAISATTGLVWYTGDIVVQAMGVKFNDNAANDLASMTMTNTGSDVATTSDSSPADGFTLTLQKSGGSPASRIDLLETAGVTLNLNAVTQGGAPGPNCVVAENDPAPLNLNCAGPGGQLPMAFALNWDNVAPAVVGAVSLPNPSNNWIGPNVSVSSLAAGLTVTDGGVGGVVNLLQYRPTGTTAYTDAPNGTVDIPESTTNTAYDMRLRECDALGNCTNSASVVVGSDQTDPVNIGYAAGTPADMAIIHSIAAPAGGPTTWALTGGDALSGPFDTFGTLTRLNASGTTTCVFGSGSACNPVSNDPLGAGPFTVAAPPAEGFYTLSGVFRDLARNEAAPTPATRISVSDATAPLVQNIVLPSLLPNGGQATFSATATDNLDLNDWQHHTIYGDGSELPYSTPTAFDGFGPPLIQSQPVTATVDFIRSIEFAAANPGAASGTVFPAVAARFSVRDQALNGSSAFNNFAAGTVTPGVSATTLGLNDYEARIVAGAPAVICDPNATGCPANTPSSTTVEAVARGLSGSFNFPFTRVILYRFDGTNYHVVGSTTTRVSTDNGVAGDPLGRVWTYGPLTLPGNGLTGLGAVNFVLVGVSPVGDALISGTFAVTIAN